MSGPAPEARVYDVRYTSGTEVRVMAHDLVGAWAYALAGEGTRLLDVLEVRPRRDAPIRVVIDLLALEAVVERP